MNLTTASSRPPDPTPPTTAAVAVRDLAFAYGEHRAMDGLTLDVPAGSIFGLLGPNGAGKSTLLSMLIGRRFAASGTISILGQAPSNALRRRIAMVFQEPSLDPVMTVQETMHLQSRMFGLPRARAEARTTELLERVSLFDRAKSPTSTLSGGMKRRLELARALLTEPELILLDEPTLALDPDSRLALWQHLVEANRSGCTLLLATNDVAEAERYCDRVAFIAAGRVVAEGSPSDLKRGLRRDAVKVDWKAAPSTAQLASIEQWDGVGAVRVAAGFAHITVDQAGPFLAHLFQEFGDGVQAVQIEESTLEDAYFQIVGTGLGGPRGVAGVSRE